MKRPVMVICRTVGEIHCSECDDVIPSDRYVLCLHTGELSDERAEGPTICDLCVLSEAPAECALVLAMNGLLAGARSLPADERGDYMADAVLAVQRLQQRLQADALLGLAS